MRGMGGGWGGAEMKEVEIKEYLAFVQKNYVHKKCPHSLLKPLLFNLKRKRRIERRMLGGRHRR